MAWLLVHAEGAEVEAHGLELVAHEDELRVNLPAFSEVRVGRLVLGRAAHLDTGGPRLRILSITLSREHFILFERDHRWYVRDSHSTGGTYLNGNLVRLLSSDPAYALADGDILHLGAPVAAPWAVFRGDSS